MFFNPFFHSDLFHLLKLFFLISSKHIGMFTFFTPISFARKLWAFKTEIQVFRDAAFAHRTATSSASALAVESARTLREYFKPFQRFFGTAVFIINPACNLKIVFNKF
jgi:hypothetical protein